MSGRCSLAREPYRSCQRRHRPVAVTPFWARAARLSPARPAPDSIPVSTSYPRREGSLLAKPDRVGHQRRRA